MVYTRYDMRAIYAGSFDPFTNGHLGIVKEAAYIFDHVTVVCAVNPKKTRRFNRAEMRKAMKACLWNNKIYNANVIVSDELVSDIAIQYSAKYLIRGLRNTMDFMYEEEIAKFNSRINNKLRTIYIRAIDETLSSSAVKELLDRGKDVSGLIPEEILDAIT